MIEIIIEPFNPLYHSLPGLKEMLNVCEAYAREYNILFDASKCKLLYFVKVHFGMQYVLFMSNSNRIDYIMSI